MSLRDLEERLSSARERLDRAARALAPKHQGGEWEEFWAAHEAVLGLERQLAEVRGEEHAVPIDFPVKCDAGAPLPYLLRSDSRCFLIFSVREHDPSWDVTVKDPGDTSVQSLALVEFAGCVSAKLGSPNDEVFEGHPLYGRGLDGYTAQEVLNSRWLAELEAINRVHRCYNPGLWRRRHHYVLWFHDTTFECVAESYKVEQYRESMADLLARACERLLS
jgi:hypothetical protein